MRDEAAKQEEQIERLNEPGSPAQSVRQSDNPAPGEVDARRCVEDMRALRGRYIEKVSELERERKPGEGIFGMRGGPPDDPCHDRYAEELAALLTTFQKAQPCSRDARLVLEELFAAPPKSGVPRSAYWMLIAVQGLCPELIDCLDATDAGELGREFASVYKRWERMPVQDQIIKALKRKGRWSGL